ncbi:MAG TPA: hypothetical protein RMG48_09210 [Myxococcales bacterium LLY-WYZ-16_1]|nr:hypothetical protein [Myxococcales bacterium LLY-WYZ-16_1]
MTSFLGPMLGLFQYPQDMRSSDRGSGNRVPDQGRPTRRKLVGAWGLAALCAAAVVFGAKPVGAEPSERTFVRVHLDFCGTSPGWSGLEAFRGVDDRERALHEALDRCLDTEFWRGVQGRVWRLAHPKVQPQDTFEDSFRDYGLFVYAHTDDRDVRDVLLADYLVDVAVDETGRSRYTVAEESDNLLGWPLPPERRAGMLTLVWVLQNQIMFSAMPRTMAAHAYREYLGLDISQGEGLQPVAGEPADYDGAGVAKDACAACHSTLDPLSYPFSRYHGLTAVSGSYDPDRLEIFVDDHGERILDMPEAGVLFGQPVQDLRQWARVAANSEAFAAKVVEDYWVLLFERPPRGDEVPVAAQLAEDLRTRYDHRVERMLHGLVDTEAYRGL